MTDLKKILYVEDDADIREVALLALELVGGFEICSCASGEEAVMHAKSFAPDMALLDVMMSGMDGPATLAGLRALPGMASLPVVFMTAQVQRAEVQRLRTLGVLDVIAKPFDPMRLAADLRDIWSRHSA